MKRVQQLLIALALLLLAAVASARAEEFDTSIYGHMLPTLDVAVVADEQRIAVAEIGIEGGTVAATGEDGTELKLVIPPRSLAEKTHIFLYPIKSAARLPDGTGSVKGAVLAPEGLRLAEPALLQIRTRTPFGQQSPALAFDGEGKALRLTLSRRSGNEIVIPVQHFSGAAVPGNWKSSLTEMMRKFGASELGDSLIHAAELEAQKARESGGDADAAAAEYLRQHAAYAVMSSILSGLVQMGQPDQPLAHACKVVWAPGLAGIVALAKAAKALEILNAGRQSPTPQALASLLAALPEEASVADPGALRTAIERCLQLTEAVCLATGDFKGLQSVYGGMAAISRTMPGVSSTLSVEGVRKSLLGDTAGVPPALVEKARRLLDQAQALSDAVKAEQFRDQVQKALERCARYEVAWDGEFKGTSYIGKGVYSVNTALQAIVSFRAARVGDPVADGKVTGEAPLRLSNCRHVFSRPTCAYFSSSRWRCDTSGPATVEISDMDMRDDGRGVGSVSLSIDPGSPTMQYNWCNQPCAPDRKSCHDTIVFPLLLTYPYSADNGPMRPKLSARGANHPVLVDGQFRGHRVDPHGDNTYDDVSKVRVVHIGTGENLLTPAIKNGLSFNDICRESPTLCAMVRAAFGPPKRSR